MFTMRGTVLNGFDPFKKCDNKLYNTNKNFNIENIKHNIRRS